MKLVAWNVEAGRKSFREGLDLQLFEDERVISVGLATSYLVLASNRDYVSKGPIVEKRIGGILELTVLRHSSVTIVRLDG